MLLLSADFSKLTFFKRLNYPDATPYDKPYSEYGLSYGVASGSEIRPCIKINKTLMVYRFTGNVMTSITTLCT